MLILSIVYLINERVILSKQKTKRSRTVNNLKRRKILKQNTKLKAVENNKCKTYQMNSYGGRG